MYTYIFSSLYLRDAVFGEWGAGELEWIIKKKKSKGHGGENLCVGVWKNLEWGSPPQKGRMEWIGGLFPYKSEEKLHSHDFTQHLAMSLWLNTDHFWYVYPKYPPDCGRNLKVLLFDSHQKPSKHIHMCSSCFFREEQSFYKFAKGVLRQKKRTENNGIKDSHSARSDKNLNIQ